MSTPAQERAADIDWQAMLDHSRQMVGWLVGRFWLPWEDAEDIAAEALARAWAHREGYDPRREPSAWLHSIAAHAAIDLLRRRRRHLPVSLNELTHLADRSESPEMLAIRADTQIRMRAVLDGLSTNTGDVIVAKYVHGMTIPEIAEALDVPRTTVGMRLWNGKEQFRKRWVA